MEEEKRLGIAELSRRLGKFGLNVLEQSRPWRDRYATYFGIGKSDQVTDIVLSDEFISDLPKTPEYQVAVDEYATAVIGRIRCGPPNVLYCTSDVVIDYAIRWPIQAAIHQGIPQAWLLVHVTDVSTKRLALCCLNVDRHLGYTGRTTFDDVRVALSRVRKAIDLGNISFHDSNSLPDQYQRVDDSAKTSLTRAQLEVERFVAGKTYRLGFQIPDVPGEVFASDPWDAEYLDISRKELSQAAYVLKARGLIELDNTLSFARPSDKLIATDWSATLRAGSLVLPTKQLTLSSLPKKEDLLSSLKISSPWDSGLAVIVADLDGFKQVNDTMGHSEGDACLERVVKAIGEAVGRKGTLYRWGGDEFAITLPDFSKDEAFATAERIRGAVEMAKAGGDLPVTVSVGVCASEQLAEATPELTFRCSGQGDVRVETSGEKSGDSLAR
jgi:diguanylate cyclase (GGDEF)-like protein